ncbi:MAG TPA: phosphogluconate dehydratase [Hyphomonadaceae bacterium]|nr:phosphogluconate dehydratase [Hyphomonadaceae bacterium]HPN05595.1 phosphogluconate dehydratase [Hyphomonadaceae bacterium]
MALHPKIAEVTARITERSRASRADYLARMEEAKKEGPGRSHLSCGNLAHAFAASPLGDKLTMRGRAPNIGIVTSYNDMLSAHQPFKDYPDIIKDAARKVGASAQVAGGVPAMCDGVTQGRPGMELSLFSRDVIALSTAVAMTHDAFDAGLMLGTCDKIVPGLVIGALSFGHLPVIFSPAGPMPSGINNKEKAKVRELFALGQVTRGQLLEAEAASYHTAGTCTFYGTANSNQMMMELMGLHLPGTAFVNPDTPIREALVRAAADRCVELALSGESPMSQVVSEKSIVNAIVGLMATGGSTNHALHIPAMALAAGIIVDWDDFSDISEVTPLLAHVYPNGSADVNQFHAAGGMAFITRELLHAGLLHGDTVTVVGQGLEAYTQEPWIDGDKLSWRPAAEKSLDENILRPISNPFELEGGIRLLKGSLGRGIIKISSVPKDRRVIDAPAAVFESQADFTAAFKSGKLDRDVCVVVRFQGPRANGMPELHALTPALTALQNRGHRVALITDGRMSGASGAVPAAIHLTPGADQDSILARIQDGDRIVLDAEAGSLNVMLSPSDLEHRPRATMPTSAHGWGRELFAPFRALAGDAEIGGGIFTAFAGTNV